jgi:hypothetical protein
VHRGKKESEIIKTFIISPFSGDFHSTFGFFLQFIARAVLIYF